MRRRDGGTLRAIAPYSKPEGRTSQPTPLGSNFAGMTIFGGGLESNRPFCRAPRLLSLGHTQELVDDVESDALAPGGQKLVGDGAGCIVAELAVVNSAHGQN